MADRPLPRGAVGRVQADYIVRAEHDPDDLRQVLLPHRAYAAYALGQLQPHLFARSEWWTAQGAQGRALVLHSKGGLGNAIFALGTVDALHPLFLLHPGPRQSFLTCQVQHLETVLRYYRLSERHSLLRMLVDSDNFAPIDGHTRRLSGRDIRQINSLYRTDGTPTMYSARNIDEAVYYGAFEGGRMVAVAGTHVIAPDDGIAVLGNVFTHPARRHRGFGALVSSAVTKHLLQTCNEVVLSVAPGNIPAMRAYRRLGYREVGRLIEGAATRRDLGVAAFVRRRLAALRGRRYGGELVSVSA